VFGRLTIFDETPLIQPPMNVMLKKMVLFFLFLGTLHFAQSQNVAINETGNIAHPSAMLDIFSHNKGLLVPRLTKTERNAIIKPAEGLFIYQKDSVEGFYYFDGEQWRNLRHESSNGMGVDKSLGQWIFGGSIFGPQAGNPLWIGSMYEQPLILVADSHEVARFELNGKMGIGIVPTSTLHIKSIGTIGQLGGPPGNSNTEIRLEFKPLLTNAVRTSFIRLDGSMLRIGAFNNSNSLVIRNTGMIGMNTPNSNAQLVVNSTTSTGNAFMVNHNNINRFTVLNDGGTKISTMASVGNAFVVSNNNINRFRILNNGTTIIGNQSITSGMHNNSLLFVDGKIGCKSIVVTQDNWNDWKFRNNYQPVSLDSLKSFIHTNGYLPQMKSENEMLTEGNEVGDTDARLLSVIEDLTLYIFQLEERIKQLEKTTK
jgi:hypothetical protein